MPGRASWRRPARPAVIVEKLSSVINEGLRSPELRARITTLGGTPKLLTPQEFADFIAAEMTRWAAVIKATGVTID